MNQRISNVKALVLGKNVSSQPYFQALLVVILLVILGVQIIVIHSRPHSAWPRHNTVKTVTDHGGYVTMDWKMLDGSTGCGQVLKWKRYDYLSVPRGYEAQIWDFYSEERPFVFGTLLDAEQFVASMCQK